MTAEEHISRDVQTTLNFIYTLDAQPPYEYYDDPPPGLPKTNVAEETRPVVVHDARGQSDTFTLDANGFQFVHYPSVLVEKDFDDEDKVKTVYYAEVEDILKKHAGTKRVLIFHHAIRRSTSEHDKSVRGPIHRVHVDHSFLSTPGRVKSLFGNEAERLLKGRYRVINVWRPIANTVAHTPLALADYRTIDLDRDVLVIRDPNREAPLFDPKRHRVGSAVHCKYNPGQKFYYLSDQTLDEVVLFKNLDSDVNKARFSPHSAFHDSTSPVNGPQRQSIEIRALVFDTE